MLGKIRATLTLPTTITKFERDYVGKINAIALVFFVAHIPLMMVVAALANTNVLRAATLTFAVLLGPVYATRAIENPRHVAIVFGITAMCMGGLLVYFGQGPMQIEMHFYFFVLLALLAVFANPMVIVAAASTVLVHHLVLYLAFPRSVFNYHASIWSVVVHIFFVVLESVAACFVARTFFDSVIGLEEAVRARTAALADQSRDLQYMLDSIDQGFLTFDVRGEIGSQRSAVLESWLGPCTPGMRVWDYLAAGDPESAQWFELSWGEVVAAVLPIEVAVDQMPKEMQIAGRTLRLEYRPAVVAGAIGHMLLVLSDITAERKQRQYEEENAELLSVLEHVMKDRDGFVEFVAEADELIATIASGHEFPTQLKRSIHTLKGNCGVYGLTEIVALCHTAEDSLDADDDSARAPIRALMDRWRALSGKLRGLFGDVMHGRIELNEADYARLLKMASSDVSRRDLVRALEDLRLEPTEIRLIRLGEQARTLAKRLGKGRIQISVESNALRVAGAEWSAFWAALIHVVRNAVDHGLEDSATRIAAGKSPFGCITLRTTIEGDDFICEVLDDGKGVNWDGIRERIMELGWREPSRTELIEAMFAPGVTTSPSVTETSGRGVGMSAVRASCEALGGTITIESEPGRGTCVRMQIPRTRMRPMLTLHSTKTAQVQA